MTDRLDEGLRQAFNADADGALKGWEFTPAMQRRVLERIAAEENGGAAATHRPDRFRPLTHPWVWAAVGAAAFLMLLQVNMDGFGAKTEAPSQAAAQDTAAGSRSKAENSKTLSAPIPVPASGRPAAPQVAAAPTQSPREYGDQESAASGGADPTVAPDRSGDATDGAPGDAPGRALKSAAPAEAPRLIELSMPAVAKADAGVRTAPPALGPRLMTVQAVKVALAAAPAVGEARELSLTGLRAVGADEATLWERPLAGITAESLLAVAEDGHSAVSAGSEIFIVGPTGELERNLILGVPARRLSWSLDGRLAVVQEGAVSVYRGENLQYDLLDLPNAEVRFGPDGALAVLDENRALTLFDPDGKRLMRATAGGVSRALAFSTDGMVVETGAEAFDRSGSLLWRAPIDPTGALPLAGSSRLALWNGDGVAVVDAGDGTLLWRAQWNGETNLGPAAASPRGEYLALSAPGPDGGILWLLDADGGQLLTEALPAAPAQMAFAGEHRLLLLIGQFTQSREITP